MQRFFYALNYAIFRSGMFMRNFCQLLLLCLCCQYVSGQEILKGKVFAADTRKAIPVANVYLSNTSIGTITAEDGSFSISHFPQGRFELVISCIGYEAYTVVAQSGKLPASLEVFLVPKIVELKEVIVAPYEKNGWEQWGRFFIDNFIGTSSNALDCRLLNKESIKFRLNRKLNTLQAFADEPLQIENKGLGYKLRYDLVKFEYDFNTRVVYFQGYPFFTEMESDRPAQNRRWERNREDTYLGSLLHFMRSLFRNRLLEQKFEVRRLFKVSEDEKKRVRGIMQATMRGAVQQGNKVIVAKANVVNDADSAAYYSLVMHEPDKLNVLGSDLMRGDSIAYGIDSATAGFRFKNYLHVTYPPKKEPAEFRNIFHRGDNNRPISSELVLPNGRVISVLANGTFYEGIDLLTSGYWAWSEKIGNMLPYEYWPKGANASIH
jgi:hypothetical protein